jgi:hypothetical protein
MKKNARARAPGFCFSLRVRPLQFLIQINPARETDGFAAVEFVSKRDVFCHYWRLDNYGEYDA